MQSTFEKLLLQSEVSHVEHCREWTLEALDSLSGRLFLAVAEVSDIDMSYFLEEDVDGHEQEILVTTRVQACGFECSQHMFGSLTRI